MCMDKSSRTFSLERKRSAKQLTRTKPCYWRCYLPNTSPRAAGLVQKLYILSSDRANPSVASTIKQSEVALTASDGIRRKRVPRAMATTAAVHGMTSPTIEMNGPPGFTLGEHPPKKNA